MSYESLKIRTRFAGKDRIVASLVIRTHDMGGVDYSNVCNIETPELAARIAAGTRIDSSFDDAKFHGNPLKLRMYPGSADSKTCSTYDLYGVNSEEKVFVAKVGLDISDLLPPESVSDVTLFEEENGFPPRPTSGDYDVLEAACTEIKADVDAWLGEGNSASEGLLQTLILCADPDAYNFARNLEVRASWKPNAELVDVLESYSSYASWFERIAKWVAEYSVTAPYKAGDSVIWDEQVCKVAFIDEVHASLALTVPGRSEKHKQLVAYEKVTRAPQDIQDV